MEAREDITPHAGAGAPLDERLRTALAARRKQKLEQGRRRAAAVLIPVFERRGEPWVVVTKRTTTVRQHKGEISFPGGARDPEDADLATTALREAHEEIGLEPSEVTIVGELDDVPSFATNFLVSPFVGVIPDERIWVPSEHEIAEVIELPLPALAAVARKERWSRHGLVFPMHVFEIQGHYIWGLTGLILWQFLTEVGPALGLDDAGRGEAL